MGSLKITQISSYMKSHIPQIILTLVLALTCILDYSFGTSKKLSILLMFTISFCSFIVSQLNFKFKKSFIIVNLAANLIALYFTLNTRFNIVNIFLISWMIWYIITPFLLKVKGLLSIVFPAVILSSYIFPLVNFHLPTFPLLIFPIYIFGYYIKGMKIEEVKSAYKILIFNVLLSALSICVFLFRTKYLLTGQNIKLINLSYKSYEISVYQPFWMMLVIWSTISFGLLMIYAFRNTLNQSLETEGFEELFTKLSKNTFRFIRFFLFIAVLIFGAEFAIRSNLMATIRIITDPPALFNMIFLCTIGLVLIALTGRIISKITIGVLMIFLSIANYLKFRYFDEPFYPWDTYIIKEAITISTEYLNLPLVIILTAITLIAIAILLFTNKKIRSFFKPKLVKKLIPLATAMIIVNLVILFSPALLSKMGIRQSWYIGKTEMRSNGLLVQNLMYLKNYKDYVLSAPQGYSKKNMQEMSKKLGKEVPKKTTSSVKPNIVVIMSESFWDPTKLKNVSFNQDIMKNFNKYKKGNIISPAIGGGTANVEFEALTGLTNYYFGPGVLAYNVYIRRDTPSLVSVMNDNGYKTIAVHPYFPQMYNRDKVYNFFGFDKFITENDFNKNTDTKGPYISDDKLVDRILDLLNTGDEPKFIFSVTMQNHDPYIEKYNNVSVKAKSSQLNEEELSILSTYGEGIRDAANSLDKLITALKKSKTPTLVYFFGDHLPRLGTVEDLRNVYNRLNPESDTAKKELRTYTTPYASWSNYKKTRAFSEPFSPSHIALEVLQDSGVDHPSYFNILKGLEKDNIYLQKSLCKNVDQKNQYFKDYKMIVYDIIMGNQYLNSK